MPGAAQSSVMEAMTEDLPSCEGRSDWVLPSCEGRGGVREGSLVKFALYINNIYIYIPFLTKKTSGVCPRDCREIIFRVKLGGYKGGEVREGRSDHQDRVAAAYRRLAGSRSRAVIDRVAEAAATWVGRNRETLPLPLSKFQSLAMPNASKAVRSAVTRRLSDRGLIRISMRGRGITILPCLGA